MNYTIDEHSIVVDALGRNDITEALESMVSQPFDDIEIEIPEGDYYISRKLVVRDKSIRINGSNNASTRIVAETQLLEVLVTPRTLINGNVLGSVHTDDKQLVLDPVTALGDLIYIYSDESYDEMISFDQYGKSHANLIEDFDTGASILKYRIPMDIRNAEYKVFPPFTVQLDYLTIESTNTLYVVTISNVSKVNINDTFVINSNGNKYGRLEGYLVQNISAFAFYGTTNINIDNSSVENVKYGYLTHDGCTDAVISECMAYHSRHLNNTAYGTDLLLVDNCHTYYCQGGFDSHQTALSSIFNGCKEFFSVESSKFRGRKDVILNCDFDHEIEMYYGDNIDSLSNRSVLGKSIENSTIIGLRNKFSGHNISIIGCKIQGSIKVDKCSGVVDISFSSFFGHVVDYYIAIGFEPEKESDYELAISHVNILGNCSGTGIYIPALRCNKATLNNLVIKHIEKGIVLYGGQLEAPNFSKLDIDTIVFDNCSYGIFTDDNDRETVITNIKYYRCVMEINYPDRLTIPMT